MNAHKKKGQKRRKWMDWEEWLAQMKAREQPPSVDKTPIFDDATSMERLREAFERVRRNGGAPGGDGMSVELFALGLPLRLLHLRERLRDGSYEPGPLAHVRIPKKSGGFRVLSIPCVVDRVAQTAVHLALQARAEATFEDVSFAYRPGRSVQQALMMARRLHAAGFEWVVDADIRAFFDNVPHAGVLSALAKIAPERPLLQLVEKWLAGSRFPGRGLPQGMPISPLLANVYLDHLDEVLIEAGFRLVRYADDFIILCRSAARAERALRFVASLLKDMGLELNPEKTVIRHLDEGYRFLGEDMRRTTLARQLRELEEEAENPPETAALPPLSEREMLEGKLGVPGSRRLLGRDYAQGAGPAVDDIGGLDDPLRRQTPNAQEDEEPPPLEPSEPAMSGRYAPFIRPLYLTGRRQRLDVWQKSALAVFEDERLLGVIHPGTVDRIDIFPGAEATTEALRRAAGMRIPVYLLAASGRVEAALTPAPSTRASVHLAQACTALDEARALALARRFVSGRIYNQRRLLQRLRNRLKGPDHAAMKEKLQAIISKLDRYRRRAELDPAVDTLDRLRGLEAAAAKLYWPALAALLRRGMAERNFRRVRMPAGSPFNTLLNWTATLLRRDMETLLVRRDVHPGFGVLHAVDDTRRGLVFDLMEEFRAPLAEGLAVRLLSKGILGPDHFETFHIDGKKAVWLVNGGAAKTAREWEKLMDARVKNPHNGEWTTWRGMMNAQVSAYVAHVLGEANYEPYRMDF